jgi:hypothetical protein
MACYQNSEITKIFSQNPRSLREANSALDYKPLLWGLGPDFPIFMLRVWYVVIPFQAGQDLLSPDQNLQLLPNRKLSFSRRRHFLPLTKERPTGRFIEW